VSGATPNTSCTIRDYTPADEAALIALVRGLTTFEGQWYDRVRPAAEIGPWYVADLLANCARDQGIVLLAERDGQIAGYATIYVGLSTAGERDDIEYRYARIGDLFVLEPHRNAGIGRALIAECEARTRAAGVSWITIRHVPQNTRSAALYERLGFEPVQTVREKRLD
jgi:GNAT superfamily N-acetyltransferase